MDVERSTLRQADLERIRFEIPDHLGHLRGKVVNADAVSEGTRFAVTNAFYCCTIGAEIFAGPLSGPQTGYSDVQAVPDLTTLRPVPWDPGCGAVLCDVVTSDGTPYPLCQREAVRRAERALAEHGLTGKLAFEFEIFLFHADQDLRDNARYAELRPASRIPHVWSFEGLAELRELSSELVVALRDYGAGLATFQTEWGRGAIEVALEPAPPLEAADRAARLRLGIKELCAKHGFVPTFMAKWNAEQPGSSGHLHQSAWREGEPAFWRGPDGRSEELEHYLEGLLSCLGDCSALFAPYANSYLRPNPALWAPTLATWGKDNRSACCRVIAPHASAARIELRRPGADVPPYLAAAASVASGAHGLRERLTLRKESPGDASNVDAEVLPASLAEAIDRLDASALARDLVGVELIENHLAGLRAELAECERLADASVPPWQLARYFEMA
jgi:glutamine synthetase